MKSPRRTRSRTRRSAGPRAVALVVAMALVTRRALAEEPCSDPRVHMAEPLGSVWERAYQEACPNLPRGAEGDPNAEVTLRPIGPSVVVDVRLADGRTAVRVVSTPDQLASTLEAVLRLPPPVVATRPPRAVEAPPAPLPVESKPDRAAEPTPRREADGIGLDAGVLFGGRVAGGEPYLSLVPSLFGQVRVRGFVLGITTRWEVFQGSATSRKPEMETLGAGLVLGRRVGSAPYSFDFGLSPRFAVIFQETGRRANKVDRSVTDLRIAAMARGLFGKGNLKFVAELDFEISPADLRNDRQLDERLPLLPSWSAGLSFGAAWSDP